MGRLILIFWRSDQFFGARILTPGCLSNKLTQYPFPPAVTHLIFLTFIYELF